MARFLLDTNIVSFVMREHPTVTRRFLAVDPEDMVLSSVVEAELLYSAARLHRQARVHVVLSEFLRRATVLAWDSACAAQYGRLRAELEAKGTPMEVSDTMIAAHALAIGATVVTNDHAFARVKGLKVVDWTKGPQRA